jgi:hypothetical protein
MNRTSLQPSPLPPLEFHAGWRLPSLAGAAAGAEAWELGEIDPARLRVDLATALRGWDWSRGFLGHSLPLTIARLSPAGAAHHNNRMTGTREEKLDNCPCFQQVFDAFHCEKLSFRILRTPARASYTLHADRDIGEDTYRFQIPILTDDRVRVLVSRVRETVAFGVEQAGFVWPEGLDRPFLRKSWQGGEAEAWYERFVETNRDLVRVYVFPAGKLCHFDTRNYHNVWNFSSRDRYTLVLDLIADDRLRCLVRIRDAGNHGM